VIRSFYEYHREMHGRPLVNSDSASDSRRRSRQKSNPAVVPTRRRQVLTDRLHGQAVVALRITLARSAPEIRAAMTSNSRVAASSKIWDADSTSS
jgi:hypothetical protein